MRRTEAIAWVVSVCSVSLRLSQAKTLAILVAAAMHCQRVSLANLGRSMLGNAKHQIKRAWRFVANDRVETADAMGGIIARLLRKRKKTLLVSLDWTDIRGGIGKIKPLFYPAPPPHHPSPLLGDRMPRAVTPCWAPRRRVGSG